MGLGGCIILIAVGAILTFATDWDMQGVNLDLVGVIFMIVGLIGVATFSSIARRRRVVVPRPPRSWRTPPARAPATATATGTASELPPQPAGVARPGRIRRRTSRPPLEHQVGD